MKKIFLYTLLSVCFISTARSQFKLGVRGGLNVNNVKVTENDNDRYKLSYKSGLGFHFGLTSQLQISKLYIQPDLLFSTVTHEVTVEDILNNGVGEIGKQRFNKFDIPIVGGLKFDNHFKIGAGPIFTKVVSSKSDVLDPDDSERATVGYQFVAGFDWDDFNIELRYEGNLSKYGSGVRIGGSVYDFDKRTNQLILSMAFYF